MSELKAGSVQSPLPVQPIMTMGWVERGCWLEGKGAREGGECAAAIFHLIALRSAAKCPIDFSAPTAAAASRLASNIDRPARDYLRSINK